MGLALAALALSALREERPEGRVVQKEHGTPQDWKFTLPKGGDPARGRAVFVKFECFACHEVKGEKFPAPDPGKVGPELSAMAAAHPPEYFAESRLPMGLRRSRLTTCHPRSRAQYPLGDWRLILSAQVGQV